ncbi:class I SAM-dependent methyltransferase [Mycobacterium paraterrae]|uniref:S-adenosyl-L-methionine-dependent methyltransferase n=1 Tax=Mycobacterium paraterrae TaxID=577492 RepID=A0ABY3VH58_9MYCO|nr:class I SAM-dependent methyltransferase [Mycobacterium paraterrae]UMB68759.1 class I SAM-dependent methyltransferase [Mycobacterium paraterrae]
MARTDDDSWEITESVGATALGVAAARAADTESSDPLISDPFARVFLDRVGHGVWDWYGAPELPAAVVEAEPDMPQRMQSLVSYFATRTKFFDTEFIDAANAGVRQAVILAAGLDARSWRLPWPDGAVVYELDQDRVLDFKLETLHEHGAEPKAHRVPVAVDLRQDWPTALRQAGFDPSEPSFWSIEGLLMYLPAAAQDRLFERIQELAAPGSRIAVEGLGPEFAVPELRDVRRARMDRVRELMAEAGSPIEVPKTDELWYFEEREDVSDWLRRHGWKVTATPSDELMASYGRPSPEGLEEASPTHWFISGEKR